MHHFGSSMLKNGVKYLISVICILFLSAYLLCFDVIIDCSCAKSSYFYINPIFLGIKCFRYNFLLFSRKSIKKSSKEWKKSVKEKSQNSLNSRPNNGILGLLESERGCGLLSYNLWGCESYRRRTWEARKEVRMEPLTRYKRDYSKLTSFIHFHISNSNKVFLIQKEMRLLETHGCP